MFHHAIAVSYVYTDDNDPWSYTTCDEAYGHLCGYLQSKGLDALTARNIAIEQLRQALTIYEETYEDGPFVLGYEERTRAPVQGLRPALVGLVFFGHGKNRRW